MDSISELRERLLQSPEDWDIRLTLGALLRDEKPREAALLVATAPKDPTTPNHAVQAAALVHHLDDDLSLKLVDRALAQDSGHVESLILRALIYMERGDATLAKRSASVAAMIEPDRLEEETELLEWLESKGQAVAGLATGMATAVVEMDEPEPVAVAVALDDDPEPSRAPASKAATASASSRPPEKTGAPEPAGADREVKEPEKFKDQAEEKPRKEEGAVAVEERAGGPVPARRRMLAQKASAFTVAVAVHAFLILLLGVLSVIVPEPKVSELVGIVAPEAQQETPQTKKIVPTSMPTPTVSVSPARFINAVGVSQVSLPTFEASTADPLATDIATTDVGASFAMPFAGKGTSQVNFFGIKSAGKRVAFLIDAEKYMLTDQRGGYPAYQIVKEEIAGMIGKMGLETRFNVILFEENNLSAFSDKLLPATAANKGKVTEWLEPVNREYEKLGLRAINYPIMKLESEVEPVKTSYLRGYLRAIQCAMELDVDTVFLICSGYRGMWVPRDPEEYEKLLKKMRWTEKDDQALAEANEKARAWLKNENEKRKEKGIPERVIINLGQIRNELGLRPRTKPGGIQITAEEREDQVANAMKLHYLSKDKPKPQINFVIFIGADDDDRNVPQIEHFKTLARRAKAGKVRVLQGLGALKNVTGRK